MKLFKRGRFRSQRSAKFSDQVPEEDFSIGSNLSEDDRFDILVPERSAFLYNGYGRDEDSIVSSLTLHERHYRASSRQGLQGGTRRKSPKASSLGGCCYASTGSTVASTAKTNDYTIADATQATGGTAPLSTSSLFDFVCCTGPTPMDEGGKLVKRTIEGRDSVASLVPTNSLFDSVMSEEDLENAEEITVSSHKRRKPWKLRGLPRVPWRRARQQA
jgi:hypothetical protein